MFDALSDTFRSIAGKIRFSDDEKSLSRALDELKKSLLRNDVHHKVCKEIIQQVESKTKTKGIGKQSFLDSLQESLQSILQTSKAYGFTFAPKPPTIVLMTGLQGSGKTTSCAKLAHYLKTKNKKVLLAACDLQRLAAITQLKSLGEQIEVEVFSNEDKNADVIQIAKAAKEYATNSAFDVLIIDTAGRLAIDEALMGELENLKSTIKPNEIFYVADSLSGQDGVKTAASFNERLNISGVILSKFDSDSKGGIALSIAYQIGLPLRFMGVGEKIPDFEIFLPDRIISRLMGAGDIASLAEKTASIINEKEAKDITKKLKKGQFGFNDFIAQLENMKKLGSMRSVISMIPGLGNMANALKDVDLENSVEIKNIKAMVNSMTPKERENPDLLNGSRRKRIALGCGLDVSDINRIIKQFDSAAKMAKRLSNKGGMKDLMSMMGQMQQFKR